MTAKRFFPWMAPWVAAAALLAAGAGLFFGRPAPVATGSEPSPARVESRGAPLDGIPDYAMPFLNYRKPDRVFFTAPNEYNGPGREAKDLEADAEIRMGLLAPLDGPAKAYGVEMQSGAVLAVEQANARGGVRGKKVVLFSRDDKGTMGEAANGSVALVHEDRVLAILGTVHSGNTHVLSRAALKMEVPFLTSVSTDPTIAQHSIPWAFRCLVDDQPQGRAIAKYLFETKRYERVCTMWFNNKYGRMGIQEVRNIARRLGHPVLYDLSFNSGDKDFTSQLTKVKESGAQALVLWGLYKEIAEIVKQARAMDLPAELIGGDGFVSQKFLEYAGEAAEGVVATYPYDVEAATPENRAFVAAFTARWGHAPDSFGAHGFDAMNVLLAAVEKGGQNRARVRDALAQTTDFRGVTGHVTFDNVGNDKRVPPLARVVGGRFVQIAADGN